MIGDRLMAALARPAESCHHLAATCAGRANRLLPRIDRDPSRIANPDATRGALMRFVRRTIQFIVDCFEALTEDDAAAERRAHEARLAQQRWHEFLSR
jgi:hypothetical protein